MTISSYNPEFFNKVVTLLKKRLTAACLLWKQAHHLKDFNKIKYTFELHYLKRVSFMYF